MRKHLANIWALLRWLLSSVEKLLVVVVDSAMIVVAITVEAIQEDAETEEGTGEEAVGVEDVADTAEIGPRTTLGTTTRDETTPLDTTTGGAPHLATGTRLTATPPVGTGMGAEGTAGATAIPHKETAMEAGMTIPGETRLLATTTAEGPRPWSEEGVATTMTVEPRRWTESLQAEDRPWESSVEDRRWIGDEGTTRDPGTDTEGGATDLTEDLPTLPALVSRLPSS